jgi:hypothetical protein
VRDKSSGKALDDFEFKEGVEFETVYNCNSCEKTINFMVDPTGEVSIEEYNVGNTTWDLIMLPPQTEPVFLVVSGRIYPKKESEISDLLDKSFWYDENTCPTNWIKDIEVVVSERDCDPHGLFQFVRSIVKRSDDPLDTFLQTHEVKAELLQLFPEIFAGVAEQDTDNIIDGCIDETFEKLKLTNQG